MIRTSARIAQLVERDLAKVEVAGSNPVSRSIHGLSRNFRISHFSLRNQEDPSVFQAFSKNYSSSDFTLFPGQMDIYMDNPG